MHTLLNILEFILIREYNIHHFERHAGLEKGILMRMYSDKEELEQSDILKVAKAYKEELEEEGFVVINSKSFGSKDDNVVYILNDADNPFDQGTHEWTDWAIENYFRKK